MFADIFYAFACLCPLHICILFFLHPVILFFCIFCYFFFALQKNEQSTSLFLLCGAVPSFFFAHFLHSKKRIRTAKRRTLSWRRSGEAEEFFLHSKKRSKKCKKKSKAVWSGKKDVVQKKRRSGAKKEDGTAHFFFKKKSRLLNFLMGLPFYKRKAWNKVEYFDNKNIKEVKWILQWKCLKKTIWELKKKWWKKIQ